MKYIWISAMVLVIAACAATSPPKKVGKDAPPQFLSLSPASLGRSLLLSQLVTGEHDGQIYKIRYELDITPDRFAIVGLSLLGVTLFSIVQENGKLTMEKHIKRQGGFDLRYTLFDLYLTYWPRDVLRAALSRIRMQFYEAPDGSVRRVLDMEGEMIAEITYPSEHSRKHEIVIQHFNIPYRLRVETLARDGAP